MAKSIGCSCLSRKGTAINPAIAAQNGSSARASLASRRRVEEFMDRALMTSASNLRIVHGRGTGVLRRTVKNKIREYREVKQTYHPAREEGGDGVTVVEL